MDPAAYESTTYVYGCVANIFKTVYFLPWLPRSATTMCITLDSYFTYTQQTSYGFILLGQWILLWT